MRFFLILCSFALLFLALQQPCAAAPVDVDPDANIDQLGRLAVVNGRPAIAYYRYDDETEDGDLMYVHANDIYGHSWGAPVPVDEGADVGEDPSLCVVNGHPAISYYDYAYGRLKYVRAGDINGNTWGSPVVAEDSSEDTGEFTSLAVVNGNPAIAYYDYYFGFLMYVRALDANGVNWDDPVEVDYHYDTGGYASMLVVNGQPAIAYYDFDDGDLKYVRSNDVNGTSWGSPVPVDTEGDKGQTLSMSLVNGRPAICYLNASYSDLMYVRASDVNGDDWDTPKTLDGSGVDVGLTPSLAVVDGYPAVSYVGDVENRMKYIRAKDVDGDEWGTPISVIGSEFGWFASMCVVQGRPAFSFTNYDTPGEIEGMMYVRAHDRQGREWNAPHMDFVPSLLQFAP